MLVDQPRLIGTGSDAVGAVDQDHGEDGRVEERLDGDSVLFQVLDDVVVHLQKEQSSVMRTA